MEHWHEYFRDMELYSRVAWMSYQARTAHMLLLLSVYRMIYLFIYENKINFTYFSLDFLWECVFYILS